jgi:hypothetical protein
VDWLVVRTRVMWLLLAFACQSTTLKNGRPPASSDASRSETPAPIGGGTADEGAPANSSELPSDNELASRLATRWLEAIRDRDRTYLASGTACPFEFRDTGTEGDCESTVASTTTEVASVLACLANDQLFTEELRAVGDFGAKAIAEDEIPTWARRWVQGLPSRWTLVSILIHGNGVSFELIMMTDSNQIRGLLKDAQFESN